MNFAYTGKAQSVTLEPGKYVLECWGAQGGYRSNSSYGGKGGYSTGTLTLTQKTTIYIYVGGSGNSVTSAQLEEEFVVPCELIALKDEYEAV